MTALAQFNDVLPDGPSNAFACRDLLGWSDAQTFELLRQLDEHTTDRLARVDPQFAEALGAYTGTERIGR